MSYAVSQQRCWKNIIKSLKYHIKKTLLTLPFTMMNLRFKANYHFLLEVAMVKSKVYLTGSCSKNADGLSWQRFSGGWQTFGKWGLFGGRRPPQMGLQGFIKPYLPTHMWADSATGSPFWNFLAMKTWNLLKLWPQVIFPLLNVPVGHRHVKVTPGIMEIVKCICLLTCIQ